MPGGGQVCGESLTGSEMGALPTADYLLNDLLSVPLCLIDSISHTHTQTVLVSNLGFQA